VSRPAVIAALVLVGGAAASPPATVVPRPRFNAPAHEPEPGPELIVRHGNTLTVDTYDHRITVRITGA
jgi:hypothetical protein